MPLNSREMMDSALTSQYKGVVSLVDHKGKEPARCLDIGTGVRTCPPLVCSIIRTRKIRRGTGRCACTYSGLLCSPAVGPVELTGHKMN